MRLLEWYENNRRQLPWRDTKDPYLIWLSEIILQQTRVIQGLDYYLRFVKRWPSVRALASASEDEVLKEWQGLGYYSRARNLLKAAHQVMEQFGGQFPTKYRDLIILNGVGPYTAAAIASFSSNEAVAVVDGNVYRVLSRLYDLETPIDSSEGQKLFSRLASEMLDPREPGLHNQAVMELGALVCTPATPRCGECPLQEKCLAKAQGTISSRPVKQGKVKVRNRWFNYLIFKFNDTLWVHQRGQGDIWQGLWEYVNVERESPIKGESVMDLALSVLSHEEWEVVESVVPVVEDRHHQLTHQLLHINCFLLNLSQEVHPKGQYEQISWNNWAEKAIPKAIFDLNSKIYPFFVP
jgi:A/G-specific adenine glycosylase